MFKRASAVLRHCQICWDSEAHFHHACSRDVRCKVGLCIRMRILMHVLWRMVFINQSLHRRYQELVGLDKPLSFSRLFWFPAPTDFSSYYAPQHPWSSMLLVAFLKKSQQISIFNWTAQVYRGPGTRKRPTDTKIEHRMQSCQHRSPGMAYPEVALCQQPGFLSGRYVSVSFRDNVPTLP